MRAIRCLATSLVMTATLIAAVGPAFAQNKTASQFYLDYQGVFQKATKVDELIPYMSKERADQINSTPADERGKMFEFSKMMAMSDVKVVKETKTTSGATLNVEGVDPDKKKATGVITVIKENGAWKLDQESWSSSS
jgi:hypothetical protein